MRQRNLGYERQDKDFYPTPAWVTEALLRTVCLPKRIWEPCCGDGAMARVLESHGHHVVATDLVDRGYGKGGRDFLMESRLPDGVTAIVTNPPYGGALARRVVDHALELMLPVGGMVALLMNVQWQTAKTNSARCRIPAFDASVILTDRIRWIPDTDVRGSENHCWMVWDFSRAPGRAGLLYADPDAESEPETRWCIECRTPLPSTARADKRHCSATCRKRDSRSGMAQRRTA
jgi:hypothetical protein